MIEKTYDPKTIEQTWYHFWEQAGYFAPSKQGEPYCIILPPPNVTGSLHMGHGFQVTLMDALIRYHRMSGRKTLWQVGTDHAGIATQIVVEKQLLQEGIKRQDLGRDAFEQRIWEWKNRSDRRIKDQLRRMGASVDWSREKFSLDPDINRAVTKVFITLYEEGLIYRGNRLVNWDPHLQTAVSDLEVQASEESGFLWYIRYPLAEQEGYLMVATTRPETLLGDTAVAVHPEDERYRHLIGKLLNHPLTGRKIPIIADTYVDPAFGTGCVKITPAHDFNDYAIGQRHHLPFINIFTKEAFLNNQVPAAYQGLERFEARKRVIEDLDKGGFLEKTEAHRLQVPRNERTGVIIEPYLTDQWYIRMQPLAEAAIEAVKQGKMQFVPDTWSKSYFQWLSNIQDWCISRQLWWGHRIPIWYDPEGNVYVAQSEAAVREKYHLPAQLTLTQDEDVLDTWVSASLWPFATLGWPEATETLHSFYPTQVLVTGFDILFFWVARMIMMGLKFTSEVPFQLVYMTGLIRDSEGQKMSKSKGNILDPIDLIDGIGLPDLIRKRCEGLLQPENAKKIEQATRKEFPEGIPAFGTDALRFTYCALANTGRNINFDLGRMEGYRNFCNKLWNAARYVLLNTEDFDSSQQKVEYSQADRWIESRLQATINQVIEAFADYRFDLLAQSLYEFIWNEYCDWYLEFSKPILIGPEASPLQRQGTRLTLLRVLETVLRLLHPVMPFITEDMWQRVAKRLGKQGKTIMLETFPTFNPEKVDLEAEAEMNWLKQMILSVRQIRGEMNISPGKPLVLLVRRGHAIDRERIARNTAFLQTLARLESIAWLENDQSPPPAATAVVNELELFIPLAGAIDKAAELQRLDRELAKIDKELLKIQQKLSNQDYVEKAPQAVVEKERQRSLELQALLEKLKVQRGNLESL